MKQRVRALVVDDSAQIRAMLSLFLRKYCGYIVTEAATAAEAETLFAHHPFELILLDYQIGEDSGVELLCRLKRVNPNCPVLFITASADLAIVELELEGLTVPIIPKPFRLTALKEAIAELHPERALEEAHQQRHPPLDAAGGF